MTWGHVKTTALCAEFSVSSSISWHLPSFIFRDACGKAHTLVNWLQPETQQNPSLVELRRPLSFLFWNCSWFVCALCGVLPWEIVSQVLWESQAISSTDQSVLPYWPLSVMLLHQFTQVFIVVFQCEKIWRLSSRSVDLMFPHFFFQKFTQGWVSFHHNFIRRPCYHQFSCGENLL